MEISTVMELIVEAREQLNSAGLEDKRQVTELLAALQEELANNVPSDISEAFMMATEVTSMLEEDADPERAARIARTMTEGLMILSKMETTQSEAKINGNSPGRAH